LVPIESTRQVAGNYQNIRIYCWYQNGTLFIVPTYNFSLVNEIYNHGIFILGTQVVKYYSGSKLPWYTTAALYMTRHTHHAASVSSIYTDTAVLYKSAFMFMFLCYSLCVCCVCLQLGLCGVAIVGVVIIGRSIRIVSYNTLHLFTFIGMQLHWLTLSFRNTKVLHQTTSLTPN